MVDYLEKKGVSETYREAEVMMFSISCVVTERPFTRKSIITKLSAIFATAG